MAGQKNELKKNSDAHTCKFCNRSFTRESSLVSHQCEPKRRHNQQGEKGVQLGLQAYLRFYEITQSGKKAKSYEEFASSPYYIAFVKFGRYCVDIRCVNFIQFTTWLLTNNKKLDYWCSDKLYTEWVTEYIKKEAVQDALERGLKEMQQYAADHPELKNGYVDYFRYGNVNRIIHHIATSRISPWVVFNCASGVDFLSKLDEAQLELVMPFIDPAYWNRKFKDYDDDADWVKEVLKAANL
jgi:hypothetical protein